MSIKATEFVKSLIEKECETRTITKLSDEINIDRRTLDSIVNCSKSTRDRTLCLVVLRICGESALKRFVADFFPENTYLLFSLLKEIEGESKIRKKSKEPFQSFLDNRKRHLYLYGASNFGMQPEAYLEKYPFQKDTFNTMLDDEEIYKEDDKCFSRAHDLDTFEKSLKAIESLLSSVSLIEGTPRFGLSHLFSERLSLESIVKVIILVAQFQKDMMDIIKIGRSEDGLLLHTNISSFGLGLDEEAIQLLNNLIRKNIKEELDDE